MTIVRSLALIALCCALSLAAIRAALMFQAAQHSLQAAEEVIQKTPALIAREGEQTRAAALIAIAEQGARINEQIAGARQDLRAESQAWRVEVATDAGTALGVLDSRAAALQRDANGHGLILEQLAARELGRAVDSWDAIAKPAGSVAAQVADAAPALLDPLVDCEDNPSCFENRWRGLTFDFEQTMRAVKDAAPRVGRAAGDTSASVASIAATGDRWLGKQLAPKNKKQTALAVIERFGLIGLRAWLLL